MQLRMDSRLWRSRICVSTPVHLTVILMKSVKHTDDELPYTVKLYVLKKKNKAQHIIIGAWPPPPYGWKDMNVKIVM